ncbi:MAG: flagellar hook-associated protein FlgK [Planctomycetota bacterium]|nr:flagellar hook-associated protein FlgK [Planctomycetota bacterium]
MSLGFGLGAGLRALTAARIGMQTAGNNVANANTPGYTRQRVELASSMPFMVGRGMQVGSGVDVTGITRLADGGLERRLQMQLGLVGGAEVDYSRYNELEGLLGEPDSGLSSGLSSFFGSMDRLRTDPADRALRGGVVQSGNEMAQGFRSLQKRLGELAGGTFEEVRGLVRKVNQLSAQVAGLNEQIISLEANGSTANDLRDTREQNVKELSSLIDVRAIERGTGSLDLLVGGRLLVTGTRSSQLSVGKSGAETTEIRIGNEQALLNPADGRIAALLRQETGDLPGYGARLDELARNMILEVNRRHTTGIPRSGPFHSLDSFYGVGDGNNDGTRGNELLSQSGLPFDVLQGELFVNVTDSTTGAMTRSRIAVDPESMTLQDLAASLSAIDHVTATIDPTGRLRIASDNGYGFDFSPRVDPNPDNFDSFGGSRPSIGAARMGPFDLSGQTFPTSFTVTTGGIATNVTLQANEFLNPAAATVDELVTAINADLGSAGVAAKVGGRLVIRSADSGAAASLTLANAGASTTLSALGLATTTAVGADTPVEVTLEGTYTGSDNGTLVFAPNGDGQIGVSPDLRVNVFDANGSLVTTLNIGNGYDPGTPISLGNGVSVSFGSGVVHGSQGNVFAAEMLADSDSSDVLAALGLNSFFHGSGASDIEVNQSLLDNVDSFAAGIGTASGDAGNLVRLQGLQATQLDQLQDNSLEDFWATVVGDVGFATEGAKRTLQAKDQLLSHLMDERESISGVNLDEEMLDMTRYQQSFEAAARFLSTVQSLTEALINIGR